MQAFATALEQANGGTQSLASLSNQTSPPTANETPPPSSFAPTRPASSNKNVEPPFVVPLVSTSNSIPVSATSIPEAVPTPSAQPVMPPKHHISRRTVLVGLAGLVAVGGGAATWLVLSHKPPMGTTLYTYRGHSGYGVWSVAWSPDGRRIASGDGDGTVQVWEAANGGNVFTYRGHHSLVSSMVWSPDGRRITSGSNDNTVQVWDAADGGHVFTYRGHYGRALAVAWSPDGTRIASGSDDGTVQVWEAV